MFGMPRFVPRRVAFSQTPGLFSSTPNSTTTLSAPLLLLLARIFGCGDRKIDTPDLPVGGLKVGTIYWRHCVVAFSTSVAFLGASLVGVSCGSAGSGTANDSDQVSTAPNTAGVTSTLSDALEVANGTRVGNGSYAATVPAGFGVPSDFRGPGGGVPVRPKVTENVTGPIPTNDWWSSLIWQRYPGNPYSENMYAHPLTLHAKANGLGVGYPTEAFIGGDTVHYQLDHREDLSIGVVGLNAPETRVDAFSDWTVTPHWTDGSRSLRATIGHGLPYVYAETTGGDAQIVFSAPPQIWSRTDSTLGVTINGHHFGIFAPSGASWSGTHELRSDLAGCGYYSVAALPDPSASTLERFRRHAFAFVSDTTIEWSYDEANAEVVTDFTVSTDVKEGNEATPLLALYRHQWLHSAQTFLPYTYTSPRGEMKVAATASFHTRTPFSGVLPALPNTTNTDADRLYGYVDNV